MKNLFNQSFVRSPKTNKIYSAFSDVMDGGGERTVPTEATNIKDLNDEIVAAKAVLAALEARKAELKKSSKELSALAENIYKKESDPPANSTEDPLDDSFHEETISENLEYSSALVSLRALLKKKEEVEKRIPKDGYPRGFLLDYKFGEELRSSFADFGDKINISDFLQGVSVSIPGNLNPELAEKLAKFDAELAKKTEGIDDGTVLGTRMKINEMTKELISWLDAYDPKQGGEYPETTLIGNPAGFYVKVPPYKYGRNKYDDLQRDNSVLGAEGALEKYRQ